MEIPGYHIEHELGRGGMAVVYLAVQEILQRRVALKVMASALVVDETFRERFIKEGRIIAQLTHPQIVTIYDFGSVGQHYYYLTMEYLPGGTLEQRIEQGLSPEQVLFIIKSIAGALGYAHQQGVIHRDIKPQNILFRQDGTPVLTDFGIARFMDAEAHLTKPGLAVGSPHYMSPERVMGRKIDARSDIYSLGILFYQMLVGEVPYKADSNIGVAMMHCTAPIPLLPPPVAQYQPILAKLLAKEPNDRYATSEELIQALNRAEAKASESQETSIQGVPSVKPDAPPFWSLKKALAAGTVLLALVGTGIGYQRGWIGSEDLPPPPPGDKGQTANYYKALAEEHRRRGELETGLMLTKLGLQAMPGDQALLGLQQQITAEMERNREVAQTLVQAQQRLQEGALEESLAMLDRELQQVPDQPKLLALRAQVQEQLTRRQKAAELLAQAQRQYQAGALEDSANLVKQGLQIMPKEPQLLALSRRLQADLGQRQQAAQLLLQAQDLARRGELQDSLEVIDKGLRLAPGHAGLQALRSQVQAQLERRRQGEQAIARAKQLQGQGRLDDSLKAVEEALQSVPGQAEWLALRDQLRSQQQQQQTGQVLVRARQLQEQGRLDDSLKVLEEGLQAAPEQPQLLELRTRVQAQVQAERALIQAEQLQRQGRLEDSLKAIDEGLRQVPDHPGLRALRGSVQAKVNQDQAERLRLQAELLFRQGALEQSRVLIDNGLRLVPDHPGLRALREQVQAKQQEAAVKNEVAALLKQCEEARRAAGQDGNAADCYRQVLTRDPANAQARQGLTQMAQSSIDQANSALSQGNYPAAEAALQGLEQVDPNHPQLAALRQALQARRQQARQPPPEEALAALLRDCAGHVRANRLTSGPGGNALDCYREVLKRDAQNAEALAGLEKLATGYASRAEAAIQRGRYEDAEEQLKRLEQINPNHPFLAKGRQALQAQREQAETQRRTEETRRQAAEAEAQRREEARRQAAEAEARRREEARRQAVEAEARRREEARRQTEAQRRAEEARRQAEAQRRAEEARRQTETQRQAEEARRQAEAQRRAEEARRQAEAQRRAEEARRQAEAQRRAEEEAARQRQGSKPRVFGNF